MNRRKYLAISGGMVALAGCSGISSGDEESSSSSNAEAIIKEYMSAFCSKDAETVNELQSSYGIEDNVTESELYDMNCSVSNIQEQNIPAATDEGRFLENPNISELRYYSFTYTFDGETQETTIMLALQNEGWKVLDIG